MISTRLVAVLCTLLVAGCATSPKQIAVSHEYRTPDQKHWAVQISMHTGVPNTPIQSVLIVYNTPSEKAGKPIAIIEGQTKTLSDELTAQIIAAVTGLGSAAITGNYSLLASQANCPEGSICGTLVQVQNSAGASADAAADSSSE